MAGVIKIHAKEKGTESKSLRFCAFRLLYAFGFSGFLVTGLSPFQSRRFMALSFFCSFFESFSKGTNFSIKILLSTMPPLPKGGLFGAVNGTFVASNSAYRYFITIKYRSRFVAAPLPKKS